MNRRMLTTGDIARYCDVTPRTVIRWIQRGHLRAHQLPGRGDNRVDPSDFLVFLDKHALPVPVEFAPASAIGVR